MTDDVRFVVAVAVAVLHGDHILVVRRASHRDAGAGLWEVPSGRLRPDEEPLDAATRELWEETGLRLPLEPRPIELLPARRAHTPMLIALYRGCLRSDTPRPAVRLSQEHQDAAWWTLDRMARSNMPPRLREALRLAVHSHSPQPDASGDAT